MQRLKLFPTTFWKVHRKGDSSSTWINGGDLHIREIIESELRGIAKKPNGNTILF